MAAVVPGIETCPLCGDRFDAAGQHTTRQPFAIGQLGRHPCPAASKRSPQSGQVSIPGTTAATSAS